MNGNELASADSRVGWAWDAKVTTPYVAMLRDREHQVELVIPYDPSDQVLNRRHTGSMVRWGDDRRGTDSTTNCRVNSDSWTHVDPCL